MRVMFSLWKMWARARAEARCAGLLPGCEPQKTQTTVGLVALGSVVVVVVVLAMVGKIFKRVNGLLYSFID